MAVRRASRKVTTRPEPPPPRRRGAVAWLLVLVLLAVTVGLSARLVGAWTWPQLRNPFAVQEIDRSGPALLQSMRDMSRYVAAEGTFQVVIDLERNRRFIPDALVGDRILFVAVGSVEGYVDFGGLTGDAVVVSPDRTAVEITLPPVTLTDPRLDVDASYVVSEERGLINRIGSLFDSDPDRLTAVYQRASEEIRRAAGESGLAERTRQNTEHMLRGMLRQLGFTQVAVAFAEV